ncbi:hypothetical protein Y032_0470g2028 [Ancylostoma ceylanicum]|uniref:Uncharacterized protein n=1 Tax=Ancylostoma ceylanicum TaxID=53326 RepID=A0A016WX44_9BILA|nr:hypothetical protein Y032_0470g2028 [Ancylostoma ceylanicum]
MKLTMQRSLPQQQRLLQIQQKELPSHLHPQQARAQVGFTTGVLFSVTARIIEITKEVTTSTTTEAPANSTKRTSQPPAPPTSTSTEVANSTTTEAATTSTEKRSQPTAVPTNTSSEATTPAKSTTTSLEIKTQPTSPPTTSSTGESCLFLKFHIPDFLLR